jgi:hypothetical protein
MVVPMRWVAVGLLSVVAVAGCGRYRPEALGGPAVEQRTTEGLTAEQMFTYRMLVQNGREPTFDEKLTWRDNLDRKISGYLREHPEDANSIDVSKFRFARRASVGMSKEQILILLGPPGDITADADRMQTVAKQFWPDMKGNVTEAWLYPLGWSYFFAGDRLVDITQHLK